MLKPFPLNWCLHNPVGQSYCWDVDGLGDYCVPFDRFCRFAGVLTTGPAIPNLTLEVWGVFFPVWIFACSLSLSFWSNFSSQWWHLNGSSPVWSLSCTLRSSFCTKVLSQWWHLNGFSLGCCAIFEPLPFACSLNGCSQMCSQLVLLDEFLITVVVVEWFFTSVNPFMHS